MELNIKKHSYFPDDIMCFNPEYPGSEFIEDNQKTFLRMSQ